MRKPQRHLARSILVAALVAVTIPFLGIPSAWAAAPTISSFTPTTGVVGTVVTITGTGFMDSSTVTSVAFNGTVATTFTVNSDVQITATVPAGATTGPITATDSEGTGTSATNFTVTPSPVPTITSFTPTSGPVGTVVTITGTGFTGASAVQFNGVAATTFTVTSDTQISATVPTGATTGPISVVTPGGTATSATDFTVTPAEPVTHDRSVTLNLRGHLVAKGKVNSDFADCESGMTVKVQRRKGGNWRNVGSDVTDAQGKYRADLTDREGRYRAIAPRTSIGDTDVCLKATSPKERHRH